MTYGYDHFNAEPIMLRHTSLAADDKMFDIYAADQVIKNGSIQGDTKTHWHFFTNSRFSLWFFNLFSLSPLLLLSFSLSIVLLLDLCADILVHITAGKLVIDRILSIWHCLFALTTPHFLFLLIFFISTWRHCSTLIDLKTTKAL